MGVMMRFFGSLGSGIVSGMVLQFATTGLSSLSPVRVCAPACHSSTPKESATAAATASQCQLRMSVLLSSARIPREAGMKRRNRVRPHTAFSQADAAAFVRRANTLIKEIHKRDLRYLPHSSMPHAAFQHLSAQILCEIQRRIVKRIRATFLAYHPR